MRFPSYGPHFPLSSAGKSRLDMALVAQQRRPLKAPQTYRASTQKFNVGQQMYILRGQRTAIAGKAFSSGGVEVVRAVVGLDVGWLSGPVASQTSQTKNILW